MSIYIVRRLLQMIPLLLLISLVIFTLTALQPGDPIDQFRFNPQTTAEDIARLRASYGLDQPIYKRYWAWLTRAVTGDLGYSQVLNQPVTQFLFEQRLPNTLLLSGVAFLVSICVAIPLGIFSALRQYSSADYFLTFMSFIGFSVPVFWLGIMLIYLFAVVLPTATGGAISLPAGGIETVGIEGSGFWIEALDRLKYLILPVFALGFIQVAAWTRFMRASMLEVINQDYVRTARAKGLSQRVVTYKHALRNAVIPIVTILGLSIPGLLGGATLTETVFIWPGMGRAIFDALVAKDYNIVMAALTFLALMTVVFTLITDLAYAIVDPRIRYS
ncbi:ABC transporter permease [Deinococcus peraridilitoris]|uniref:ABC-type dipeptide/oligopeptide/nickel transport system, permease component n=1 Tax=Deinococcus peraridilitoris (strain DSM 19664 / LMG 22246 / CIP 109416 / KR-200) TaxID=937777 RepID=K9ZYF9_DEIPD|nr:ABC transporter permease [Deinococcus peraridilitoris]AFZ66683.1 ABC-type dipeptide/oligopeptide/nickel transport system, permease component [Deinococcus peraridilitoris DSM 19664]